MEHTKGPLTFGSAIYQQGLSNFTVDDEFDIHSSDGELISYTIKEADARLYSCAPEMLEALIKLYKWQQRTAFDISLTWMSNTGKLIEKATGLKIEEILK